KRDALLGAVHRLEKIDAEPILRILSAHGEALTASRAAALSPSEQIAEQIGELADILEAGASMVTRAFRPAGEIAIILLLRPLLPARIDLAAVIAPALLRIVQDRIGGGDLLELLLGRLVARIEIGVQLLGELTIGLGDVRRASCLGHTESGIQIVCHLPFCWIAFISPTIPHARGRYPAASRNAEPSRSSGSRSSE